MALIQDWKQGQDKPLYPTYLSRALDLTLSLDMYVYYIKQSRYFLNRFDFNVKSGALHFTCVVQNWYRKEKPRIFDNENFIRLS